LETRSSVAQTTLAKINAAFTEYIEFYGSLVENGIEETEYNKIFDQLTRTFRELYTTAKSNYDALLMNKSQFEEGRLERDAYERALIRIEENIIAAEFDIGIRVLPYLKRVNKELLQKHILKLIEEIKLSGKDATEVKFEVEQIKISMTNADKEVSIEQVKGYVSSGKKIMKLGKRVWKIVEATAPAALPLVLKIFIPI
jgi:translation elongation factor EF-1beta